MTDIRMVPTASLSDDDLVEICQAAEVIACECPGYLARLVKQVRQFRHYTYGCIKPFPEDAETHRWLAEQAQLVEDLIYQTMLQLMQREGLIDEASNTINLAQLSKRAQEIVDKQLGL